MSIAVENHQPPLEAVANLQTTITDIKTVNDNENKENETKQSDDVPPDVSPRVNALSYTKEKFMTLKDAWLSNIRPAALSDKYCNREGIWDPELWYYSSESENRSASPIDNKKKYLLDGIVLSPQGRSFVRGCQVNVQDGGDARNKLSGRLGRGWDAPTREKGRGRGRMSPNGDIDRRFERNSKNERNNTSGKGRRRAGSLESKPEWFTHGPSSQRDTIELRGFDDLEKGNKRKKFRKDAAEISDEQKRKTPEEASDDSRKFDINEFFDMAENALPITGMYENQGTSSRFTQWFANERRSRSNSLNASLSGSRSNSRRSSIADELAEIAGLTLSSPVRTPTPEQEFMFAPIVPASETCEQEDSLNIIQDNDVDVQPLLDSVIPHKTVKGAVTLEDLEGKGGISNDVDEEKRHESEEKEGSQVFLKLVETMKASGNLPEKPTPTIPDIPPHLLPRPPSAKDKNRMTPVDRSRSPSPLQLLQEVIRRTQSPVGFVNHAHAEPRLVSSYDVMRAASPAGDIRAPGALARPLTPEEIYGPPPVFNMENTAPPDLFEFTGAVANINKHLPAKKKGFQSRYPNMSEAATVGSSSLNAKVPSSCQSGVKPNTNYPAISQAFVPTSVLRKYHCDKHDQKSSDEKEHEHISRPATNSAVISQNQTSPKSSPTLMSPREFTSPKTTSEALPRPELLTPHRLPLPGSPSMTPHSLPLPQSPMLHDTPKSSPQNLPKPLLTPHSLPLPQSPLVTSANSNPQSDFGIRPLPKTAGIDDSHRLRGRSVRKQFEQRTNMRRFPQGQMPFRPVPPNMVPRPGMVPNPFNMNTARAMNVHPTALALALRNQQYQMARAAAVAAATAVVNRPPVLSQAQAAAAAAMMLNQQRAAGGFHGIMPQVNPRMFPHTTPRPNLPPALQRQHHVVHHSDSNKDRDGLSKWFSDAVLSQSQSQTPGRGAKVLSVEELERHTCV
ncbi:eukaryotic translation initiation factor 4E transporter-like isoform X2 [Dendronephthya gigantea]|uniref:eukaryotic translation initiation factor 4E transporter-like isoform X2 n=1 Tax=Dendronephthya gigantea TaxID=151771 RepID=UPI00106DD1AC|nr:eukaryotic translation initiation factor 4E transporter-like isoform X2 [Dendronephthya gigantea]